VLEFLIAVNAIRPAEFIVEDFYVLPLHMGVIADGLEYRFFGGESSGKMLGGIFVLAGVFDLLVAKNVLQKIVIPAVDGFLDAFDFNNVHPDAEDRVWFSEQFSSSP